MRSASVARAVALLLAAVLPAAPAGAVPVLADSALEGRPVRRVQVITRDIWEPLPAGRFAPLYALMNTLHVRTRPITVRAEVLVRAGDSLRLAALEETARNLRTLDYLVPVRVQAEPAGDSADVVVETRDSWTTSPEVNLEGGGGRTYGTLAFTERNLLGLGTSVSVQFREDPTGSSRSVSLSDGNLFGTHLRGAVGGGSGEAGKTNFASLESPFYSLHTRYALGGSWSRTVSEAQLFADEQVVARFGRRVEVAEIHWGTGVVAPDGTVQRFVAALDWQDRRLEPTRLEPGAPPEFGGPLEDLRLRRVTGEIALWRPRWLQRSCVDRFDRVEDFDVGTRVAVKAGVSPRLLDSSADEGYVRLRWDAGLDAGGAGFGLLRSSWSARLRSGMRESLGDVRARWVVQPHRNHTTVVAALGQAGYRMPRDFQLELGGLSGLRAYAVHALHGTQAWRLNAEHRWIALRDCWQLVSFGGAAFVDAGRTWGPGSGGKGWHEDVGLGLRISLPHSALNQVARFDVAWPVGAERDGRGAPRLSFGSSQAF